MRAWMSMIAVGLVSCASGEFGEARQAQIDPQVMPWVEYSLWLDDGQLLAEIFVFGGRDVGAYRADTEYWYVDRTRLDALGRHSITITKEDGDADPPQPDLQWTGQEMADPPGVADPPEPDLQTFTQPVHPVIGWGAGFLRDPIRGGVMMQSESGHGLRLLVEDGSVSRVVWYQEVERGLTPMNITPEGEFRVIPSFTVAEGFLGYAIDLAVQ
jgi:hypothetical protein